jgi:single-strand DNA-binding protein
MMSVNKWIGIGNVVRDVELKKMNNGVSVVNIALACNEKYKDKSGVDQESTEFVNVVLFDKLADIVAKYVKKGSPLYVEGKIKTDKYVDKAGVEKYSTKIVAQQMQLLSAQREVNEEVKKFDKLADIPDDLPF